MAGERTQQPLILTSGASGRVNALLSARALRRLLHLLYTAATFFLLLLTQFRRRPPAPSPENHDRAEASRKGGAASAGVVVRLPGVIVARRKRLETEAVVRRTMAVRQVTKAREEGDEGRSFLLFRTAIEETLFTQSWTPLKGKIRGLVVILHGLNEHSGRYNHFAKKLNDNGFKVYAMDWIGHGGSDGLHGYVQCIDHAVDDLKAFVEDIRTRNPGIPCFCFGHSTGAAIILKGICGTYNLTGIEGVVLTSPAVRVQPSHPIIKILAPVFCLIAPRYQFAAAAATTSPVSRDPRALRSKYSDPLVFTGAIRVRTGYEILCLSKHLQQNLRKVETPFLVLHGSADTVTDPRGSEMLFEEASSADKSIRLYQGLLHDLLIEPESDEIMEDIIEWLCSRV